jgi:hypothetical protein
MLFTAALMRWPVPLSAINPTIMKTGHLSPIIPSSHLVGWLQGSRAIPVANGADESTRYKPVGPSLRGAMRSDRRRAVCMISAVVLCVLPSAVLLGARRPSHGARFVTMEISTRDDVPALRLAAKEGESAILEHPDLGKFEFKPSFKKGDDAVVVVSISDAGVSPPRRLADVNVPADGKQRVESKTSPNFRIRIARIVET